MKTVFLKLLALWVLTVLIGGVWSLAQRPTANRFAEPKKEATFEIARRPWTHSRLTGSPDPPLPYRSERVFPKLQFKNPLILTSAPGTSRLFIGEQAGKIFSFPNDPGCTQADLFIDLAKDLHSWDPKGKVRGVGAVYGLTFHPQFAQNRYCYICYVLDGKSGEALADGSRVSRFRVSESDPPRCDPKSETILLTFLAGGHNGGCLKFGPDGYLYISTGDATSPNPPDGLDTGQDVSDLLSSILRIDVDHPAKDKAYSIPADNPFVTTPGARPEIWSFGFRNPWKMSFDRATGDLWVGDVGWELWEMVFRIVRGGNYGWSVMEGRQQVRPESRRGPTPILPPTLDFPHTEAASITGGFVYRGKKYPDLVGTYICGDWVTRTIWGTRFDGDRIVNHRVLTQTTQRIVDFAEDHAGELYILDYDEAGGIYQLVPNETPTSRPEDFPRRLSETGLFTSTMDLQTAPGVLPFTINAEQWADHATAQRHVGLPGMSSVKIYDEAIPLPGAFFSGKVFFPKDGVLAKTISLEMERGNPSSKRRLETQVLHFDGANWRGYTYAWNDEQTDATLVPAAGDERVFEIHDSSSPGGVRRQTWRFPSRTACLTCHNPWAGPVLSFTEPQLNDGRAPDSQLEKLCRLGVVELVSKSAKNRKSSPRLLNPHAAGAGLDARARAYLDVNCSHCHRMGAGGTADLELRFDALIENTKTVGVKPVQGTFDIPNAQIIALGDPYRSVLYYRIAKLGPGRMPHMGSEIVDEHGLELIGQWIQRLPLHKAEYAALERLRNPVDAAAAGKQIERLLATTTGALMLAQAVGENSLPEPVSRQSVSTAIARPQPVIRDLFERFVPNDQRVKRLGSLIKVEQLLQIKGDATRGKALFFENATMQCKSCHRVHGVGSTLGPDLTTIGKKYSRAQILESILDPSKFIEPKYLAFRLETTDGQIHGGLLIDKNDKEVVLRDARDQELRIAAKKVAALSPQKASLMPELLLRDMTAEQAADLLEFLASLK